MSLVLGKGRWGLCLAFSVMVAVASGSTCVESDFEEAHLCLVNKIGYVRKRPCALGSGKSAVPAMKDEANCPAQCKKALDNPDSNVGYIDTECVNGHRTRRYFWRDPHCVTGFPPLPVHGIPCEVVCGPGEHVSADNRGCAKCPAGTFSRSGGEAYEDWNVTRTFPEAFRRECLQTVKTDDGESSKIIDCPGWVAAGKYAHSGNNPLNGPDNEVTYSSLELPVTLVRPGRVTFRYRVDSASSDGLFFDVDGKVAMPLVRGRYSPSKGSNGPAAARAAAAAKAAKAVGGSAGDGLLNTTAFETFSMDLGKGFHSLKWVYAKNERGTAGRDRAEIEAIEVMGTRWTGNEDVECVPCAPGTSSGSEGAVTCDVCAPGTKASGRGNTKCTPCNKATEFSFEGASMCIPRKPCTTDDYERKISPCVKNTRAATYAWRTPKLCDDRPASGSVSLPKEEKIQCAPCQPGTAPDAKGSFSCTPCPVGQFSPGGGKPCKPCADGEAAMRAIVFEAFDEAGKFVGHSSCQGGCGTNGWHITREGFLTSGLGHQPGVSVTISFDLNFYIDGYVTFDYFLDCRSQDCDLVVYDGYDLIQWRSSVPHDPKIDGPNGDHRNGTHRTGAISMMSGGNTVKFVFSTYGNDVGPTTDHAIITRFAATGVDDPGAGAETCTACGPGQLLAPAIEGGDESASSYFQAGGKDRCSICAPGTFSDRERNTECQKCPVNSVAPYGQSSACQPCGPGSGTNGLQGALRCETECAFDGRNLTVLDTGAMYGPIVDDGAWLDTLSTTERRSELAKGYYLSVCHPPAPSNDSCIEDGIEAGVLACRTSFDSMAIYGSMLKLGIDVSFAPFNGKALPPMNNATVSRALPSPANGVVMMYTEFDNECPDYQQNVNVTFVCDPDAGTGTPTAWPGRSVFSSVCHYDFLWRSAAGCRLCKEEDWMKITSTDCIGGVARRVDYVLKEGIICYGGAAPPPPDSEPCSDHVHVHVYWVTIAAVLVTLLAAGMLHVWLQNRRMYAEYARLVGTDDIDMMDDMGNQSGSMMESGSFTIGELVEDDNDE